MAGAETFLPHAASHTEPYGCGGLEVGEESDPLTEMGSATTSQTAIGVIADQEEEEIQQPLTTGPLGITGTFSTKRHVTQSSAKDYGAASGKDPTETPQGDASLVWTTGQSSKRPTPWPKLAQKCAGDISPAGEIRLLGSATQAKAVVTERASEWVIAHQMQKEILPSVPGHSLGTA